MQRKGAKEKKRKSSRDSLNNAEIENSLEVITGGMLRDIARPSLSRGSTRSLSQLSMQNSTMSFELESLPVDETIQNGDLFLEEAVIDDSEIDESNYNKEYKDADNYCGNNEGVEGKELFDQESSIDATEEDLNSKEFEKEIMKIAKRVRQPKTSKVSEQLALHSATIGNSTDTSISGGSRTQSRSSNPQETTEEKQVDPKIRKGLERIKKLDGILAEKMKIEKETKAERRRMEREWQLEIKGFVEWCGENKYKPVIQQFLALTSGVGDSHLKDDDYDDLPHLFQTEIETDFAQSVIGDKEEDKQRDLQEDEVNHDAPQKLDSDRSQKGEKISSRKSKKKNFLKRNIELAGHANEIVSLTELEKQRLDELLADDNDLLLIDNPFTKHSHSKFPSGYELDDTSKKALTDIDERLRCLVPESDFQSICFSPRTDSEISSPRSLNFSEFEKDFVDQDTNNKCGEESLQQEKHYRLMSQRLQQIEAELERLDKVENAEDMTETPRISDQLLRQLLDVDSRLTSSALSILSSAQSNLTGRTDSATLTEASESTIDTSQSFYTEKSFHSVGV